MHLRSIEISGLRSFTISKTLLLAVPNGEYGSGVTVLVGPNNGGKSTIIEAFAAITQRNTPSFTEGKRNRAAGDRVSIKTVNTEGGEKELRTVPAGGSEAEWENEDVAPQREHIFTLPSRRAFNAYFGKDVADRAAYSGNISFAGVRNSSRDNFSQRLFQIQNNRTGFDNIMRRVLDPVPAWMIDQNDSGNYYLKFQVPDAHHTSEGLGEGIISLIFIVDALYDSEPNDIIVIDEPELSLHPSLQKKLSNLLMEYGKDRQIIISTHSPYFIDWRSITGGGKIIRVNKSPAGSDLHTLSDETVSKIKGFITNVNNPHILGLDAREAFFFEERVILVEGQEDVVFFKKIAEKLEIDIRGDFFGWGVGGADNMKVIAQMFKELGFSNVIGILDNNKAELIPDLEADFPDYDFLAIPADDVRTKPATNAKAGTQGVLDHQGNINPDFEEGTRAVLEQVNAIFAD